MFVILKLPFQFISECFDFLVYVILSFCYKNELTESYITYKNRDFTGAFDLSLVKLVFKFDIIKYNMKLSVVSNEDVLKMNTEELIKYTDEMMKSCHLDGIDFNEFRKSISKISSPVVKFNPGVLINEGLRMFKKMQNNEEPSEDDVKSMNSFEDLFKSNVQDNLMKEKRVLILMNDPRILTLNMVFRQMDRYEIMNDNIFVTLRWFKLNIGIYLFGIISILQIINSI